MSTIIWPFLLLFALISSACTKQPETCLTDDVVVSSENVVTLVPLEDALGVLYDFMAEVEPQSLPTRSGGKTIASIETFSFDTTCTRGGGALPDAYVVNFSDDGGYAVLGANTAVTPIVAYTESGSIDLSKALEDHEEELTPEEISQMQAALEDEDDYVVMRQEVNDGFVAMLVSDGIRSQAGQIKYEKNLTVCKPLLSYSWDQGDYGEESLWNKYCKYNGKNVLAGCSIVALGMIEAYVNYGRIYTISQQKVNLSDMYHFPYPLTTWYNGPEGKLLEDMSIEEVIEDLTIIAKKYLEPVGLLLGHIFDKVRKSVTDSGTAVSISSSFDYCKNHMNNVYNIKLYKGSTFTNEMIKVASKMLLEKKPMFVAGGDLTGNNRHAWVIDGAMYGPSGRYYDRYMLHCNWGWCGKQNGYFSYSCFNPYHCNYSSFDYKEEFEASDSDYYDNCDDEEYVRDFRLISYDTYTDAYKSLVNPIIGISHE